MLKYIKNAIADVVVIALFMASSVMAPIEAKAKEPKHPTAVKSIKIIGKTADGKYNVYQLDGELDDERWTSGGKMWNSADLLDRMEMIEMKDVNNGSYKCGFICKDGFQNVVGISPKYAFLKKK